MGIITEVRWLSVIEFFLGRPWPRFIRGGIISSADSVGSRVSSEVGRGVSSPSSSSSSSSQEVLDRK
jgi:hypothetical protein